MSRVKLTDSCLLASQRCDAYEAVKLTPSNSCPSFCEQLAKIYNNANQLIYNVHVKNTCAQFFFALKYWCSFDKTP